jgi:hypothetical protein
MGERRRRSTEEIKYRERKRVVGAIRNAVFGSRAPPHPPPSLSGTSTYRSSSSTLVANTAFTVACDDGRSNEKIITGEADV